MNTSLLHCAHVKYFLASKNQCMVFYLRKDAQLASKRRPFEV